MAIVTRGQETDETEISASTVGPKAKGVADAEATAQAEQEAIELAAVREAARKAREAEAKAKAEREAVVEPEPEPEVEPAAEVTGKVEEAQLSVGALAGKESAERIHPELVELVERGAPAKEIYELARRLSGSYAAGVRKQLASQFRTASELENKEQFEAYQKLGVIEKGAAYAGTENGKLIIFSPDQVDLINKQIDLLESQKLITPDEAKTLRDKPLSEILTTINIKMRQLSDIQKADILARYGEATGASIEELKAMAREIEEKGIAPVARYVEAKELEARKEFEATLKTLPIEYQEAYRKGGVVLEDALLAGVSRETLLEAGFDSADIDAAAKIVATHTRLPDNQWIDNEQLAKLKTDLPEAHKILIGHGIGAFETYLNINYITLPDGKLMAVTDADAILTQSKYGYDILRKEGYEAYQKAVDEALEAMKPFKRPSGYNMRMAAAQGISEDTMSLIFPPEDVEKVKLFHREPAQPLEVIPEEVKPVSGLPPKLIPALAVMGGVAVAEPTPIGEVVVGAVLLGAVALAAIKGKDVKWGALWNEMTDTFRKETGREPTKIEVAEMKATATNIIKASNISVKDMPDVVTTELSPVQITITKGKFLGLVGDPIVHIKALGLIGDPVTKRLPSLIGDPATAERLQGIIGDPATREKISGVMGDPAARERLSGLMASQAAVADAEKELDEILVVIRPKIVAPGKFPLVTVSKTETALIALDEAVGEAYASGEIDEKAMRSYQSARDRLLARRGELADSIGAYAGGLHIEGTTPEELKQYAYELFASGTLPIGGTARELQEAIDIGLKAKVASRPEKIISEARSQDLARLKAKWAAEMEKVAAFDAEGNRVIPSIESVESLSEVLKEYHGATDLSQEIYLAKLEALDQAINKYIGEYNPQLSSEVNSLLASATQQALQTLQQQATQAATEAYQQALAQELTQTQAQTAAQTAAQQAIQQAAQTAIQQAVKAATQTATKTATKAVAKTLTSTATQTAVQTLANTAVNTATATMAQTATTTATGITPIIPPIIPPPYRRPEAMVERMKEVQLPEGTIAFKMGTFWKYMTPPWTQRKFLTLPKGAVPAGAINTGLRSPYQTIQVIGKPRAEVPETISADIGIADIEIYDYGRSIRFAGRGTLTNVGERLESSTKGISIPSVGIEDYRFAKVQTKPKRKLFRRPEARKYGRSRKKRNWLHEVTRPPTFSEIMG